MKVKNLTSETRPLKVVDLSDNRELTIYIEGKSSCELSNIYVADTSQLRDNLVLVPDIGCIITPSTTNAVVEEYEGSENKEEDYNSIDDTVETEEDASAEEESSEDSTSLEDKFICDVCGAEFASARGLNTHKNRSHPNEDDK